MEKIKAKIVADSISPQGHRITSILCTYPRFIHGEVMTHRLFSRNSASSRAIPFEKMVKMVEEDPFIPIAWQKDHKGMQGTEYITDSLFADLMKQEWLVARDAAILSAKRLNSGKIATDEQDLLGRYEPVTKQLCNRLLEPFMWHTTLITATEWENFFELRCPKYKRFYKETPYANSWKDYLNDCEDDSEKERLNKFSIVDRIKLSHSQAEIHIQALAEAMWDAMNESVPKSLEVGEWHIPFGDKLDGLYKLPYELAPSSTTEEFVAKLKIKIATARCARLSYMTHDGEIDYEKDIRLHDQLFKDRHLSPFEHCARAMSSDEYYSYHSGELADHTSTWEGYHPKGKKSLGWCNNFRGWIQYRYLIENT